MSLRHGVSARYSRTVERIDVACAALIEIAVRGVVDGVAALPGIVRRERQHAHHAPDPVVGERFLNSAPMSAVMLDQEQADTGRMPPEW